MVSLILAFLAGVSNALMDLSSENRFNNKSLNKSESSKQKWKQPQEPGKKMWYHISKPRFVEKFPYSSTMLVLFTDFWHKCKSAMLTLVFISVVLYQPIIKFDFVLWEFLVNFLLLRLSFGFGFSPLYKSLKLRLIKNRNK